MTATSTEQATKSDNDMAQPFNISIIGNGIIGVSLALGLLNRNIPVTIYEQAHQLKEIGAGIGISEHIEECMGELDPRIPAILSRIGVTGPEQLQWVDGSNKKEDFSLRGEHELYDRTLPMGQGYYLCHRAELLDGLVKLLPEGCLKLEKRLDGLEQRPDTGKVVMTFTDGTKVETDAGMLIFLLNF